MELEDKKALNKLFTNVWYLQAALSLEHFYINTYCIQIIAVSKKGSLVSILENRNGDRSNDLNSLYEISSEIPLPIAGDCWKPWPENPLAKIKLFTFEW